MNEPDWIDRLLQDAIKKDRSHDFEEFEEEFEALKVYLKSRNSRAVIVAAACLAVFSCALNGATKIQRIDLTFPPRLRGCYYERRNSDGANIRGTDTGRARCNT